MIYAANMSAPVKKAYGELCMSTTMAKIIEQLSLDPELSGMDACVLGPKDVAGINGAKLKAAMVNAHPNTRIIYIYSKDKEGQLLDIKYKKQVKKVDPVSVKDAVDSVLNTDLVSSKDVVSSDTRAPKPITSAAQRPVNAGGMKGGLFGNKKAKAQDAKAEKADSSAKKLEFDPALELYYVVDPLGQMVYMDPTTQQPLKRSEVAKRKKEIEEARGVSADAQENESTDENDGIDINLPETGDAESSNGGDEQETVEIQDSIMDMPAESAAPQIPQSYLERHIAEIKDFNDWGLLEQALQKDTAMRSLLEENSTYQGVVNMLDVLDKQIKAIYYDPGMDAKQKFDKILEVGSQRSTLMAQKNDMVTRKVLDIIESVTISARRTVDDVITTRRKQVESITLKDKAIADDSDIRAAIEARGKTEFELLAVIKGIISIFKAIDVEIDDTVRSLDAELPSDNKFINDMMGPATKVLTPVNTKALVNTMMKAISEKRGAFQAMEGSVRSLLDLMHDAMEKESAIIEHYQYMTRMLIANRVEDAVIIDSIIKNVLNVYIGAPKTGRTATALTWSGCQSRCRNTLLVDLTDSENLKSYGVEPAKLDDFMRERIEREFCIVEGRVNDIEELHELIAELKTRLDYYAIINVLVDYKDVEFIKLLAENALTLNYITNCTNDNIQDMSECYNMVDTKNVARKIVMIDPPINVLKITEMMGADPTIVKCVSIPNVQKVRMCALTGDRPYEYSEVRAIYEDAFK